jgi:HK97 family phage portal protein
MPNKNTSPFFFGDSLPERKSFDMGLSFITNTNRSWLDDYHDYGGPINYTREAGRLDHNAIVMACANFAKRAFPEAPLQVLAETPDGPEPVLGHALPLLVRKPNPYYNGILLWRSTMASLVLNGNGYWQKVRNGSGRVIELWYEPHLTIRPVGSAEEFISHYELYRWGRWLTEPQYRLAREDVIHFRTDLDPDNPRLGVSDLAAAMREVFTDNEAAAFTATVLRNTGMVPFVLSPKGDNTIEDPEGLKRAIMAKTQGAHRGEPLITSTAVDINKMGATPAEMNLEILRNIPEERISALTGIPAVVAGLGAGLDHSIYNNMGSAREQAYESFIIPTQQLLALDLTNQLLPDLGNPAIEYVNFDLSKVRVLQEDNNAKAKTVAILWNADIIKLNEARSDVGKDADETGRGELYKSQISGAMAPEPVEPERDVFSDLPELEAVPAPKTRTNGKNGVHKQIA